MQPVKYKIGVSMGANGMRWIDAEIKPEGVGHTGTSRETGFVYSHSLPTLVEEIGRKMGGTAVCYDRSE